MEFTLLTIIAITLLALFIGGIIIVNNVKNTIRRLFGTSNLLEVADLQEAEMEDTPKSISGIEQLARPRIEQDFKDMQIDELKSRDADEIYAYYNALSSGNTDRYTELNSVNDKMKMLAQEYKQSNIKISNVKIHKHAISHYEKEDFNAKINFQCAVEYIKKDTENPDGKKTQVRVQTSWVFLPEDSNFSQSGLVAINCPNCGAPLKSITESVCSFCKSYVLINFTKSWILNSIVEY